MRVAATRHQVLHEHVARSDRRLSKEAKPTRQSLLIHRAQLDPIQLDDARARAQDAGEAAQERRLTARVWADNDGQLPL